MTFPCSRGLIGIGVATALLSSSLTGFGLEVTKPLSTERREALSLADAVVKALQNNLDIDNQGTQGFIYNFGNNFQSYNFRNPTSGQAWSGAMMTLGPQLSIGLIQGANQTGSPLVFPPVPRDVGPLPAIQSTLLDDIP